MKEFLEMYEQLNLENIHLLRDVYSSDILFVDPAHTIQGLDQLESYFSSLYQNVESIDFAFTDSVTQGENSYLQWDMTFRHKRVGSGKAITVSGATFLRTGADGKVVYHRDYFDLGAMIYEHLPFLGRVIIAIKRRLGQ